MHQSALYYAKNFFAAYAATHMEDKNQLIDIGAQNVNGSIKDVCPSWINYIGVDFVEGNGVDIILNDPYQLPFEDGSLDYVVCSSCFEHSQFFWLVFLEVMRVLKPTGIFYLNAPSNGFFHRYPVDCWRFYPDAGHAMVAWAERNGYQPALLESFVGDRSEGHVADGGMWNDFVSVFIKDKQYSEQYEHRVLNNINGFHNGYNSQKKEELNFNPLGPDFELIQTLESKSNNLAAQLGVLKNKDEVFTELVLNLNKFIAHLEQSNTSLKQQIVDVGLMEDKLKALEHIHLQDIRSMDDKLKEVEALHLQHATQMRDAQYKTLEVITSKDDAWRIVDEMRQSRSWLITKPLRDVGNKLRQMTDPKPHRSTFSLIIIALLVFPITFFYYRDMRAWFKALQTGKPFFSAVVLFPDVSRQRLIQLPTIFRAFFSTLFRVALSIHRNGGVLPAIRKFYRVVRFGSQSSPVSDGSFTTHIDNGCEMSNPRRILVMDYRIPMADVSAGERATVGILRDLCALGYDVVFLPNNMVCVEKHQCVLENLGVTVITNKNNYHSAGQYIREHGQLFSMFYLIRVDVAEAVLSVIRQVAPQARIIFHAPDLYFLRESREAELLGTIQAHAKAEVTKKRELAMMQSCDHIVIVSQAELPILQQLLPQKSISVFPALYIPVVRDVPAYEQRQHIFFLGGFAHTPNIDAVHWFVAHVWPLVREQLPEVEFHIVGAEAPDAIKRLVSVEGVKYVGYVEDLEPVLAKYRLSVAPLRYGAGIKGKVAMTMGAGVPCVCSTIAAEGMSIRNNIHTFVVDEPNAFADMVIKLYQDAVTWQKFSLAGRELISHHFSDDANRAELMATLDSARALPLDLLTDYCQKLDYRPIVKPSEDIDVSIIIPVYNQWQLTRACINSILESTANSDVRYELILADDGSSDDTIHAAQYYPGLSVVKTPQNMGFLRNCNYAAKQAKGNFILLLNNDTIVLPNWLDRLFSVVNEDAATAIVGSKMLYPDGKIQEAGGLLCRNGAAHNAGRGYDRRAPFFNILRETDYISGCSILIRATFWKQVGGFDERYQNAYCEDADLAMTARKHNFKVMYQPASEVIHLEHQTYSEYAEAKRTTLQRHNTAIFLEKWQADLQNAYPQHSSIHLMMSHAERVRPMLSTNNKLNILYFSPFPSHPTSHGNRATIYQYARRFQSMGHKVHFVLLKNRDQYTQTDLDDMSEAWDTFDEIPYGDSTGIDPTGIPFDGWYQEGLGECIRQLCAQYNIDIVFCSYVFQSKLLEYVPEYMVKVIDTHDKMGNRYEMLRANGQPLEFFSCSPEEEGAYLRRADLVIARRQEEADYFDSVTGVQSAIVVPHVEPPVFLTKNFMQLNSVGVVASANRINLALVLEFLQTIDRYLTDSICPFTVHVAGEVKNMVSDLPKKDADVFNRPWVKMHGFVPEIADFYQSMDLIVSPVTMGTGINVKTVQAMAYGMPLLTTVCGSKGIETSNVAHNHEKLDTLVEQLFILSEKVNKDELDRLATLSRERYHEFYSTSVHAMHALFDHPKLQSKLLRST